ncbi:MAG: ATP-binding protein [Lachnospiraceae bacterium]|nr:ATP-binding protein [Lachnospiraceae bacterium]
MTDNPYTLLFGQEPNQMISRTAELEKVTKDFESSTPSQMIYMITGLRGSGKTVFMTKVEDYFTNKKDWITVELSSESDLLTSLVSKLSSENTLANLFKKAKINLSFFGFGLEVSDVAPITNIEMALTKMMESIKKSNKKLLVTIDEVVNTKSMREFASVYQILIRHKLPIFLLMTGLYENINGLQNEKNLTFLYRAPRIDMKGLSIRDVSSNYSKVLKLSTSESIRMAGFTNGYPFAFQVLGHFTWEHNGDYMNSMTDYKNYLYDYVYDKIWSEASEKDKLILYAIAKSNSDKIVDIRRVIDIDTNSFNPYKKRLKNKGLIDGDTYGRITFILPLFKEYVLENYE